MTRRRPGGLRPNGIEITNEDYRTVKEKSLLRTGLVGSAVAALCCFTPILVILLGAVGLSAWLGWLDYVLFPALAGFLGLTAYALYRRRQAVDRGGSGSPG
jgi:mercuric ion transport protein